MGPYSFIRAALRGMAPLWLSLAGSIAVAGPVVPPGDIALRHDIQRLADAGIVTGPTTSWPLSWEPILADLRVVGDETDLSPDVRDALFRVRARGESATRTGTVRWHSRVSAAQDPMRIRGFANTPREDGEIWGGLGWTGERFLVDLQVGAVLDPQDGEEIRADRSIAGMSLGNFLLSVNTMDRWWGPGWDGSLILSSNARPIPAISFDRRSTHAFETKWLSWLGPWDFSMLYGQLESNRHVSDAQIFGLRFNFRPLSSLEIGISRTAQLCGDERPCGVDTFVDLMLGRDNRGGDGITSENEPGNQLAGLDLRWSFDALDQAFAIYGQFIGEDEAGGLPSRFLGQMGLESSGSLRSRWSYRWFLEYAATTCRFYESDGKDDCAYNHKVYRTGYRYRGRSIGHAADGDARIASAGLTLLNDQDSNWSFLVRYAELNRIGDPDPNHSLTPTAQNVTSIDLTHSRSIKYGLIDFGLGFAHTDDRVSSASTTETRAFLQWRSVH